MCHAMTQPVRAALVALLLCAASAAAEPVRVYGIEIDSRRGRDRLLIFSDDPVGYELLTRDAETLVVRIPGAVLDPSAPRRVGAPLGGVVTNVAAEERGEAARPEVHVAVTRAAGVAPDVSQRGAILALEFARPAARRQGISLHFRDTELRQVLDAVAAGTGERFIYDDSLRGLVTLIVPRPVSPAEAMELLHSALLLHGLVAVPTPAGPRKIVAVETASAVAPLGPPPGPLGGDAMLTTLVELENVNVSDVVGELEPYLGQASHVIAFERTNSLILSGSETRLRRLIALARLLDAASREVVIVRRLRHRGAEEVAETLEEIYGGDLLLGDRVVVTADARANRLVVRVPAELEGEVRERLALMDRPAVGRGQIEVVPVRYTDPERLASMLEQFASGSTDGAPDAGRALRGLEFGFTVDPETRSIILTGDPATLGVLIELIDELDRMPPRVAVELLLLEIRAGDSLDLGFDFLVNSPNDWVTRVTANPSGDGLPEPGTGDRRAGGVRYTGEPVMIPVFDEDGELTDVLVPGEAAVITAEGREVASRVVSRPHLLVSSGEEQQIFVGDNIPIPVQSAEQTNPLQTQRNIQRQDVGITLRVLPTVGEAGDVALDLFTETTRLGASVAGGVERVGPTIQSRHLETRVRLRDGIWALVGLGEQPEVQEIETGTPFLKDIPLLGWLFRSTEKRQLRNHLVLAVSASIHRTQADLIADSVRRRLAVQRNLSRTKGLDPERDGPVAVLVSTRDDERQARALADSFAMEGVDARIVGWEWAGREHFDVYRTGFANLTEAAAAASALAREGWSPEIVPVPGADPESENP